MQFFLKCFRDPNGINRVLRIRENHHWVPIIGENQVPRINEIGSLQVHTGYLTFSLKKTSYMDYYYVGKILLNLINVVHLYALIYIYMRCNVH